jgi:hypothetical protein
VHRIYTEKISGDLDQYLRAEFIKQAKGRLTVVLDKSGADAVLTGASEQKEASAIPSPGDISVWKTTPPQRFH